jgi:hypothetical protein
MADNFFYVDSAAKGRGESLCVLVYMVDPNLLLAIPSKVIGSNYSCLTADYSYLATISLLKSSMALIFFQFSCLVVVSSIHSNVPDGLGIKCFRSALLTVLTLGYYSSYLVISQKGLWSVFY